jgi:hypothetical protein
MKITDFLTKVGKFLPYVGLYIGISNRSLALETKQARLDAQTSTHNQLLEQLRATRETIISDETVRNKIAGLSADGVDYSETARYHIEQMKSTLEALAQRLEKDPSIDEKEFNFIKGVLKSHSDQASDALEKSNATLQDILEKIAGSSSGSSSNNFVDSFNSLLESYKSFLSTLEVEMYCPLLNTLGLITISFCLASIVAIIYGDLLIKYLNLEVKYPRIAKFIQLRRKFQFYYLNFNFLFILVTLITLFYFNITQFYYLYVV